MITDSTEARLATLVAAAKAVLPHLPLSWGLSLHGQARDNAAADLRRAIASASGGVDAPSNPVSGTT